MSFSEADNNENQASNINTCRCHVAACSNLPDTRMEWMKRKFIDVDTVMTGDAAALMPNMYGTYRVVGKSNKVNPNISQIKLTRSDKGNPVLRFFDKSGKEFESWSTPQECYGRKSESGAFSSLLCGRLGDRKGRGQFELSKESSDSLRNIYPKNLPITDNAYHYYSYEGFGSPIVEMSLQKTE